MTASRTRAAAPVAEPPATYELALAELEQLVAALDAGQLPLDQLLSKYQRGAQLLAYCREQLAAVESQIKVMDAAGLQNWEGA